MVYRPARVLIDSSEASLVVPSRSQEAEFSPTPSLAMSPDTPRTPATVFPPTPTSLAGNTSGDSTKPVSGYNEVVGTTSDFQANDKAIDPYTLFVGGLDMSGPLAWDEDKVSRHFSRFRGIENIKVVQPGITYHFAVSIAS
jgi:hypothetical protein